MGESETSMKRSGCVNDVLAVLLYSAIPAMAWAAPQSAARPAVAIDAPAAREQLQAGEPYTLSWHLDNPTGSLAYATVLFSADGGQTYRPAGRCGRVAVISAPGQGDFTCTWSNPGPATTKGRVAITAIDQNGRALTRAEVGPLVVTAPPDGLPWPWRQADVGAVGAGGDAHYGSGTFTVRGSGADVWGTADEFHYVYDPIESDPDDMELIARVNQVQDVNAWTKAGLMFRRTLDANAAQASIFVSPGKGIAFQRRTSRGSTSVSTAGPALTAPVWLRLTSHVSRACTATCSRTVTVRAYYRRATADAWTLVGTQKFENDFPQFGYAGLAVSSHVDGTAATAVFSGVVRRDVATWTATHVGAATGSASGAGDAFALTASGADIWGAADAFEYFYQAGNTITARVSGLSNTSAWTKAGVMLRKTVAPSSPQVMVFVTPGKGIAMQYRATDGGLTTQVAGVAGTAPAWIRLTRTDAAEFAGAYSHDGETWDELGTASLDLGTRPLAGLALTSHTTNGTSATARFEDVGVQP
jgi:hypothetical protein